MMFFANSCAWDEIKFDPAFYVPSVEKQALVNELNHEIYFNQTEIELFFCLSPEKMKELKEILIKARMPKKKIDEFFNRDFVVK